MATIYGTEMGIDEDAMISALLITQFIGVPSAFVFGVLAPRIGAKPSVFIGLFVYAGISILGYYMTTATHFYALAVLVGLVQGGTQSLSRSLFASMIPKRKSSEFFAFFGVFERYAGIFGPLIFGWVTAYWGNSRNAILAIVFFFIFGAMLLTRVDVDAGRREARTGDAKRSRLTPPMLAGFIARAAVHVFYQVDRAGMPPAPVLLILLPNHPNALLDPALIRATPAAISGSWPSRRCSADCSGRSCRASGAIPVFRKQDEGADVSRNAEMFAAVDAALARGEAICVFPEGISHSSGKLEPLRTGAARMALSALAQGTPVQLVPVGINPHRKTMFRSRMTVIYGQPSRSIPAQRSMR